VKPEWHDFRGAEVGDYCWAHRHGAGEIIDVLDTEIVVAFSGGLKIFYNFNGVAYPYHDKIVRLFKQEMKWVPAWV